MIFNKDEKSKFDFISWKAFFALLVLMGLSLMFFISTVPLNLAKLIPSKAQEITSTNSLTIFSLFALFFNFYLIYYFVCKRKGRTLKEGFYLIPKSKETYLKAVGVGILMPILSSPILIASAPKDFHALNMAMNPLGILLVIISAMIAPFLEEVFFRGLIFPFFQSKLNSFWAVVITSLFFGISHYANVGNAMFLVSLFICYGLVLSLARYFTGSLLISIIIHICHNLTLVSGFLLGKYFHWFG